MTLYIYLIPAIVIVPAPSDAPARVMVPQFKVCVCNLKVFECKGANKGVNSKLLGMEIMINHLYFWLLLIFG